jgi:peptide chain release factor 2
MVKDHRMNLEVGDVQAVMDGEIDPFIEAALLKGIGKTGVPSGGEKT